MSDAREHISQLREDFMKGQLSEHGIEKTPADFFEKWMTEAVNSNVMEVQAVHLSTVSFDGKPSSRIVYLREFQNNKFYFYTNFNSRKAKDIANNNNVCFTFFWPELERQIRIEGTIAFSGNDKSDAYFNARPKESKIGAWSSPQSSVIKNREELDGFVNETKLKFGDNEIPRPDFWGGYVLTANYYEFWQGRKSRLHDRISYKLENTHWIIERLAP